MSQKRLSETGELVRDVVASLVDFPEDVQIEELSGGQATVFEILVRRADHGKVIGKRGRLIDALRHLLMCRGGRDGRTYRVEVLEDPVDPVRRHDLSTHPSHTEDPVQATSVLLLRIVQALVDEQEAVVVSPLDGIQTAVFEVQVEPGDVRKVLGRGGATAGALRALLLSMGARANRRFVLEVLEP